MNEISMNTALAEASMDTASDPYRASRLPDHLVQLPGGTWALWRWVGLRGPGFPATQVLRLSAPLCAAAADQVLQAEDAATLAQHQALDTLNSVLESLPYDQPDYAQETRRVVLRAIQSLKKGQPPAPLADLDVAAEIAAWASAQARLLAARDTFHTAFTEATVLVSQAIREVAGIDRFREAMLWQNRDALHNNVDPLLRISADPHARDAKQRRREHLVATYLQRYCVKNDIIGFFGPVGWAKLVSHGESLVARPGPNLLASRSVDFESWCIDVLAETLSRDKTFRPWLAPRRLPFIHIDGTTLYLPGKAPATLACGQAAVLQACDGARTAQDIATDVLGGPATELQSPAEVYQLLEQLCSQGLIAWALEIPVEPQAACILRRQLDRVEDEGLRGPALAMLNELEAGLRSAAAAAGNAAQVDQAIGNLEATFRRFTGTDATRAAGQTYAGRTLLYEDCRRDIESYIGPDLIASLGPPLTLLLDSARWLTFSTAQLYRQAFNQLYNELARKLGSPTVDATVFWHYAQPLLLDEKVRPFETLPRQFQERWATVLAIPPGQRRVQYTSAALRPRLRAAFDAPHAGWRRTRYHGPDILIEAASIAAIQRGDYQFVLGEIHIGANPLLTPYFRGQHPCPDELLQYFALDLPEPHLVPVPPKNWPVVTTRTPLVMALPKDLLLTVFPDACGIPAAQTVPIGELVFEVVDDTLIVRTRDGRLRFDVIEAFAGLLQFVAFNHFKIVSSSSYVPRLTVDRLVIQREMWHFMPEEITFTTEKNEAERFLAARRWARTHHMPRWVFIKTPIEIKPFYVDFYSPIYTEIFARTVRRTSEAGLPDPRIMVSEMLPNHHATWLSDAEGQGYTSELRFVAFDLTTIGDEHAEATTGTPAQL